MLTGIAISRFGYTSTGEELVRFLDASKGRVGYGVRTESGKIKGISAATAEVLLKDIKDVCNMMDIVYQDGTVDYFSDRVQRTVNGRR